MVICLRKKRGSLSVEAALSLMIFCFAAASLVLLMKDLGTKEMVRQSAYNVSRQMATMDIHSNGECFVLATTLGLNQKGLKSQGIKLIHATIESEGTFLLTYEWDVKLPVGNRVYHRYAIENRLLTRGYDGESQNNSRQVFITQTGEKYHVEGCIHLSKSKVPILKKEAVKRGYEPCWHCIGGLKPFESAPGSLESPLGENHQKIAIESAL